jgi:UDP-2,3-diacylglucosamine pyrophosphatase LpxH
MFAYYLKSNCCGLVTDSHTHNDQLELIRAKHSKIKEWFHLGDLFSFNTHEVGKNRETMKWFLSHKKDYTYVVGNHDVVTIKTDFNVELKDKEEYLREVHKSIKVILPNNNHLLLYHSKPNSMWDFINPGYSEREFIEDFLGMDDNTEYIINGHQHREYIHEFPYLETKLVSVGAACYGEYAIYNNGKIEFKKL